MTSKKKLIGSNQSKVVIKGNVSINDDQCASLNCNNNIITGLLLDRIFHDTNCSYAMNDKMHEKYCFMHMKE